MDLQDELRPEYDLHNLKIRKIGPGRNKEEVRTIELEADVAKLFPDSRAVNEALRFLIRVTAEKRVTS